MGACHGKRPIEKDRTEGSSESEEDSQPRPYKPGFLYSDVRNTLRPFDLLLFAGEDEISAMIRFLQVRKIAEKRVGAGKSEEDLLAELKTMGIFSHVGMVVTSEILNHPNVEPGKIYVWESTMGGRFGQNVQNIHHEDFLGVQLRNFDELFDIYDEPKSTSIAVCHLENNPYDLAKTETERECIRFVFTNLFNRLDGARYNMNPVALASSMFPTFRAMRKRRSGGKSSSNNPSSSVSASRWLFCSELLAVVYTELGLYPDTVIPDNVLPMDLIGFDTDCITKGGLPCIFKLPPKRMVSRRHFDGISAPDSHVSQPPSPDIAPTLLPVDETKDFRIEPIRKSSGIKGSSVLLPIPRSASVSPPSTAAPSETSVQNESKLEDSALAYSMISTGTGATEFSSSEAGAAAY